MPQTAMPSALSFEGPTVKIPLVRTAQSALTAAGFDPGKMDGEHGPRCVAAVTVFQKVKKLVADGAVRSATAKQLRVSWPT